jgi:hypothetical protein
MILIINRAAALLLLIVIVVLAEAAASVAECLFIFCLFSKSGLTSDYYKPFTVVVIIVVLLADHRLIVERRFVHPSDPEIYAGGSVSPW